MDISNYEKSLFINWDIITNPKIAAIIKQQLKVKELSEVEAERMIALFGVSNNLQNLIIKSGNDIMAAFSEAILPTAQALANLSEEINKLLELDKPTKKQNDKGLAILRGEYRKNGVKKW